MWPVSVSLGFCLLAARVASQHVHFEPPEVSSVVSSVRAEFTDYIELEPTVKPTATASARVLAATCAPFWMDSMPHQGRAAFNANPASYQVFRNVKDFGARGDGVTDDTAAINAAISSGGRCRPGACQSSTTTPATVYFPPGTYIVSTSLLDYYYTNLIGHPTCRPVLKATPGFTGFGIIDGDQYQSNGLLGFASTNTFFRQVRNLVIDITSVPPGTSMTGIHWPTAQATSIQNVQFLMSAAAGTQHQGLFIEEGSAGYMGDLSFNGGLLGMNIGNQQFTMRNIVITNAVMAINQLWDWGWTYSGLTISNCQVALNMSTNGRTSQTTTSATLFDSTISNTPVGILTAHDSSSAPASAGSLILENVVFQNVPVAVKQITGRTVLAGTTGSMTVAAWGEGHYYSPTGPNAFERNIDANPRPASLLAAGGRYFTRSKPQYETLSSTSFVSARSSGAKGDGVTDDTAALQAAINSARSAGKILFLDHGYYRITRTLLIPTGSKITGESYPVIMSSGSFWGSMASPNTVVQIGNPGDTGSVELSDFIVSGQGAQPGATFIQFNIASSSSAPSGMWDVHVRNGGFAGSQLQSAQCPTTPGTATPPAAPKASCISGFLSMHVTPSASGLYMENCWIWTADHDLDDPTNSNRQITVYAGRGLLVDSTAGNIWLVGTAVEHHALYQYQFTNTKNVFMGQIQTETAYYQPNPDARTPFPSVASKNDPTFTATSGSQTANGWGLRIMGSSNIFVYGAGLYSFFDNYSTACSANQLNQCQTNIFSVEGTATNVNVFNLNTVGTSCMITRNGACVANAAQNVGNFVDTVALFRAS